ncbi:MAG: methionyl-tRNA formyltransferase [Bacteroidia bacterium]|nr:methionyl-tRNA formyltransferase [Bacteroidia bacterium]
MQEQKPTIVFMGTPEIAVFCLDAIKKAGYPIKGVVTTPDKPAGRGQKLQVSAVKQYALLNNIPILQPENLKDESFIQTLQAWQPDIQVVVAFRILPESVWKIPSICTFNLHTSYLPQYRGAAPIQWAIINGETETGVTTFIIDNQVDTGNILLQEKIPISPTMTAGELYAIMCQKGSQLVLKTLEGLSQNTIVPTPQKQVEPLFYAPKLTKENTQIDWSKTVKQIYNFVRGLNPHPSAWTTLNGVYYKIHQVEPIVQAHQKPTGHFETDNKMYLRIYGADGYVNVLVLQKEGKKRMDIQTFLRGNKV